MPYMTLLDIWNYLTTKAEVLGKTDCWDVDSAAGINQLISPNMKQDKEKDRMILRMKSRSSGSKRVNVIKVRVSGSHLSLTIQRIPG